LNRQEESLLRKLEERQRALKDGAFETPLADYTKYREHVARHAELTDTINLARQIFAGADEDDEGDRR